MRKFFLAILTLIYLITTTGVVVNVHYCMGKLAGWELSDKETKTCSKCGMEKSLTTKKGCCNDKHKLLKFDTEQKLTESSIQHLLLASGALPVADAELSGSHLASFTTAIPLIHAPPRNSGLAIHLRNCVFRI